MLPAGSRAPLILARACSIGVDAAFMLFERNVAELAGTVERRARAQKSALVTTAPPVPESYCMDAALMSLELRERGIHIV